MTHAVDQIDPKSVIVTQGGETLPQIIARAVAEGRTTVFDYIGWLDANPTIGEGRDPRSPLPRGLSVRVPMPAEKPTDPPAPDGNPEPAPDGNPEV